MDEIEILSARCKSELQLETAELGSEYGYHYLPLCVIDAVWSIGARYGGVRNVVSRYCSYFGLNDDNYQGQHCVQDLYLAMQEKGFDWFAQEVFQNAQRTSVRNGILKSEAVNRFASVLHKHGMNTI